MFILFSCYFDHTLTSKNSFSRLSHFGTAITRDIATADDITNS